MIKSKINQTIEPSQGQIIESYNTSFETTDNLRDSDTSYRWILEKLNVFQGAKLLDIACGFGVLLQEANLKGVNCSGLDISSTAARLVLKNLPDSKIIVANGEKLPYRNQSFDFVTNLGSLEHFINPEFGIREICRVLKPQGKAAILLPNGYYMMDLILNVLRRGYGPNHRQQLERFASVNEWKDFIELNGLRVEKVYKYNFFLPKRYSDWEWFRKHPRRIIPPLLSPFIPFNFSFSFLYICSVA